jgi:flavin-dependent dehydrogenase
MSDVLVIGGGLAGGALAVELARAGRAVTLIERERGPVDKVCGEFLSREAGLYLSSLGLDLPGLGAVAIDGVRLVERDRVTTAPLPFSALSLSRRVLDEALLDRAGASGVRLLRGDKARALTFEAGRWVARLDGGAVETAPQAALATGKHDLRGWKRPPGRQNDLVAFKLYWRLAPAEAAALDRHVELVLFPGGYAGLQPVEAGRANLCLVVRRAVFVALGQNWDALLDAIRAQAPHLDMRLSGAAPCWDRPMAMSGMPYGFVIGRAGAPWRLGDQAAVIPSFSGDGMSIALHSARLASAGIISDGTPDAYHRQLARDVAGQVRLATVLSRVMVRSSGQHALGLAARFMPALIGLVAGRTRVPDAALARAGILEPVWR